MTQPTASIATSDLPHPTFASEEEDYEALVRRTRNTFVDFPVAKLFTTSAEGLYDAFLQGLPADRRQHYDCRACRRFVEQYGGLVEIDGAGETRSPLWEGWVAPRFFHGAVANVGSLVRRAHVTGTFLTSEPGVLGREATASLKAPGGVWKHLHIAHYPAALVFRPSPPLETAEQAMAAKSEEYGMLCRGLAEFPLATVKQAHTFLTTGALFRSEKCVGVATWLLQLHEARAASRNVAVRTNLTWNAVATAPPGFCHVRSSMIGTLLEDIQQGRDFADIKRSFDAKMNPIVYQRPSAAPTDGQLAAAEALVGKLKSAGALARRYARLGDVLAHAIWTPKRSEDAPGRTEGGVFDHLRTKATKATQIEQPPQVITWEKFRRTVLPSAETIEHYVRREPSAFFAFATACDPDAPPILQWDSPEARNPVSWYVLVGGSMGRAWGLDETSWREVTAVTMQPSSWHHENAHQGDGIYFLLRDARPEPHMVRVSGNLALFPETLKSEYHGIRASIEAYSRAAKLEERAEATACGICLQKSAPSAKGGWPETFRVTSGGTVLSYRIDRWD